jgi:hypothetical protein
VYAALFLRGFGGYCPATHPPAIAGGTDLVRRAFEVTVEEVMSVEETDAP